MVEPTPDAARAAEATGLFGHFAALLAAKLAYLRARLELAGLEGKEAAVHVAVILGLVVGALIIAVLGYLFFVLALIFFVAWACGGGNAWAWVTLVAALLHFIGAATLAWIAKVRLERPIFAATLDEFKKDQEWLKNPANPS